MSSVFEPGDFIASSNPGTAWSTTRSASYRDASLAARFCRHPHARAEFRTFLRRRDRPPPAARLARGSDTVRL